MMLRFAHGIHALRAWTLTRARDPSLSAKTIEVGEREKWSRVGRVRVVAA
jgi:hypothetical protein